MIKLQILAALSLLASFAQEYNEELRSRIAEPTFQKFQALLSEFAALEPQIQALSDDATPAKAAPTYLDLNDIRTMLDGIGWNEAVLRQLVDDLQAKFKRDIQAAPAAATAAEPSRPAGEA